jgi:hypothetical protein
MKSQHLQDSTFFMLTPGVRDRLMEINFCRMANVVLFGQPRSFWRSRC